MRPWIAVAAITLLFACATAPSRGQRNPHVASRVAAAPAIVEAPSPCRSLDDGARGDLFDAFFRAHAQGRIDPNLVDAGGEDVEQTPLATELLCPASVRSIETMAGGRERVSLRITTARAGGDSLETEVVLSPDGDRFRIELASLARIRDEMTIVQLRRFLRDHSEIEQLGAIDVPFEDDFPDPSGVSPRRRVREALNLRLAFARDGEGTTLCLLSARAGSAATRSWCWRSDTRLAGVVVGAPMIVDDDVQLQVVLVPFAPRRRAQVVEVRFGDMMARHLDDVRVRPAPVVPAWAGRAREGVVLPGQFRPRPRAWSALESVAETPPWVALLSASPWLRAVPIPSPAMHAATSITVDLAESRRWLALRTSAGWALSDPLQSPAPDGLTSWDGVAADRTAGTGEGTFVAFSSDFGANRGTAHRQTLHAEGDHLRADPASATGTVCSEWPPEPTHRIVQRTVATTTELLHTTRDFQPIRRIRIGDRIRGPNCP